MQPQDVPIPERLKGFPLFRGKFLVHYTVYVGKDGVPDFKVVHESHRMYALEHNLCHLCGQGLDKMIVFIGGPLSVQHRTFNDGPMHEDCALYATKTCPFLAMMDHGYSAAPPRHRNDEGIKITVNEQIPIGRPDRMALYYTNGYDYGWVESHQAILVQAWAPVSVDWDAMPKKEPT